MKSINISLKLVLLAAGCTALSLWVGGCSKKAENVEVAPVDTTEEVGVLIPDVSFKISQGTELVTNEETEELGGQCEEGSTIKIKNSSGSEVGTPCENQSWTYQYDTSGTDGANENLTVTQVSQSGEETKLNLKIIVDRKPPKLSIDSLVKDSDNIVSIERKNFTDRRNNNEDFYYQFLTTPCPNDASDLKAWLSSNKKTDDYKQVKFIANKIKIKLQAGVNSINMILFDSLGNFSCKRINLTTSGTTTGTTTGTGTSNDFSFIVGKTFDSNDTESDESVASNEINQLKIKFLDIKGIPKSYQFYSDDKCTTAIGNLITDQIQISKTINLPSSGFTASSNNDLVIGIKLSYNPGIPVCKSETLQVVQQQSAIPSFDTKNNKPKIGSIPFGINQYPKITIPEGQFTNDHRFFVRLLDSNDRRLTGCTAIMKPNDQGGISAVAPEFPSDSKCSLIDEKSFKYQIYATNAQNLSSVKLSGNKNVNTPVLLQWKARTCPYMNESEVALVAVNSGPTPFCVAKYETRKIQNDPTINVNDALYVDVNFKDAKEACDRISNNKQKLQLINHSQWNAVASEIMSNYINWVTVENSQVTSTSGMNVNKSLIKQGYNAKINGGANKNSTTDNNSLRMFTLKNGLIYDFAGNLGEWVDPNSDAIQKAIAIANGLDNKFNYILDGIKMGNLLPMLRSDTTRGCNNADSSWCGFGGYNLSLLDKNSKENDFALVRGGSVTPSPQKDNGGVYRGILAVSVRPKTDTGKNLGFRCVFTGN